MDNRYVYKYTIKLIYHYKNKNIEFNSNHINTVVIDRDYTRTNRPKMYVSLNIDKRILNNMINHISKKMITVIINKIAIPSNEVDNIESYKKKPRTTVIHDQFNYYISSSMKSQTESLDYLGDDNKDRKDLYVPVMIGLIHPETIKSNELINTDVTQYYFDTRVTDTILHRFEKVPKLLLQPIDNNMVINQAYITSKLSEFIEMLYNKYKFYKTPYRLFFDYNCAYLVASDGKLTRRKGDVINSIIFEAHHTEDIKSKRQGSHIDEKKKIMHINLDPNDIDEFDNKIIDRSVDNLKEQSIKHITILKDIKPTKDRLELVYINCKDLDSDLLTINKEFFVDNYEELNKRRGRFIMNSKQDLYYRSGEYFGINTIVGLKFIKLE